MTNRTHQHYTTVELRTMREMVEAGYSNAEIAERLGRTYNTVTVQIHTYKLRPSSRYTPEECERILTCNDNKLLAIEMNRTPSMICKKRNHLKKAMR